MPLPPALQARLLKRGIIKTNEVEEVFAESYDEPTDNDPVIESEFETQIANCPNRTNPFHECTNYCKKRYGVKKFRPDPIIEKRRLRMLKKYPLPDKNTWKEVPDVNTNRYYYWNTETNQVCWYSPACPKAKLEYSSATKKKPLTQSQTTNVAETMKRNVVVEEESIDEIDELLEAYQQDHLNQSGTKKQSQQHKHQQNQQQNRQQRDDRRGGAYKPTTKLKDIDPMDPSSYSDVPKGKWSAGLDKDNE